MRLLTAFAFQREGAHAVFGIVADYNLRSQRVCLKNGYHFALRTPVDHSQKMKEELCFAKMIPMEM